LSCPVCSRLCRISRVREGNVGAAKVVMRQSLGDAAATTRG
jgi:hypothetical protein